VLGNVLLETEVEGLRVTATNLDLTISALVPATVLEEGRITVPARLLAEYVASLDETACTMEVEERTQMLRISSGVQRTNLHGIDAVEFPPLPARETAPAFEVDAASLQQAIIQTAVAASGDEQTPVLTGVLLHVEGSRLTLVATDRHRLAVKTLEAQVMTEGVQHGIWRSWPGPSTRAGHALVWPSVTRATRCSSASATWRLHRGSSRATIPTTRR
jgi:DNA polymerase-3 subunit beta